MMYRKRIVIGLAITFAATLGAKKSELDNLDDSRIIEEMDFEDLSKASAMQKALVKEAQRIVQLEKKVRVVSVPGKKAFSSILEDTHIIALCDFPDLDYRLFAIYHELGHVVNNDATRITSVFKDSRASSRFLEEPSLRKAIERAEKYLEIGKRSFTSETALGEHINQVLIGQTSFWVPPSDPVRYKNSIYFRACEQRADLYALEKLYEQELLTPIITIINTWARLGQVVTYSDEDRHPSRFERALYLAGFLVDKGLDINALVSQWEHHGTCINAEDNSLLGTSGIFSFGKELWKYQHEKNGNSYEQWKEFQENRWNTEWMWSAQKKVIDLAQKIDNYLTILKTQPNHAIVRRMLLYPYNYLRELLKLPLMVSEKDITLQEAEAVGYQAYKRVTQEYWKSLENSSGIPMWDSYKVESLLDDFWSSKQSLGNKQPLTMLYAYNYLRELKGQPLAQGESEIDIQWIEEL
jgi:hypothetical protein